MTAAAREDATADNRWVTGRRSLLSSWSPPALVLGHSGALACYCCLPGACLLQPVCWRRYMVLPQRPAGTEGWTEEQLQKIISRDMLIGVARPTTPAAAPA